MLEIMKSHKYILYFKSNDIYRFELFDNRLKMNNFIRQHDIRTYYIQQNW